MVAYNDYIAAAIMHNLQILPESLSCGLIILAIVLANPTIFGLAVGTIGMQALTGAVGRLMMKFAPDGAVQRASTDPCHSSYLGQSWERLLRGTVSPEYLLHPTAPSVYTATVAFIAGYGLALQLIYKDEINAGVVNAAWCTAFGILTGIILLLTLIFRTASGCDSFASSAGGLGLGLLIGFLGTVALAYSTNRRATNIWGIPLLRDRINAGAPVYVCDVSS